jgi:hypothetical protein
MAVLHFGGAICCERYLLLVIKLKFLRHTARH